MSDPRSLGEDSESPPEALAGDSRLVLTPALRVPDQGQAAAADPTSDEAVLRRMVREILEEELRGDFGARITREVRKLVRTEVRALLATREPE